MVAIYMTINIWYSIFLHYIYNCPTGVFMDSTGLIVGLDCMPITTG